MTQQEFADWFCVFRDTAWKVLNGQRRLKADEIIEICRRFRYKVESEDKR